MLFLNRKHCCFGGSTPIGLTFYLVVALEAYLISLKCSHCDTLCYRQSQLICWRRWVTKLHSDESVLNLKFDKND